MTLGDSLVNAVLIVRAVSREGRQGIGELVEQRVNPRSVIAFFLGQLDRDDFAALAIDTDMQFAPGPAAGRAVLFNQPFAGAAELQARAVHQQMQRTGSKPPMWRHFQRLAPAAQCRVIRHRESETEQSDDGADESPSVCRNARPKTVRIVSAVVIARVE
jgi:hypothetical protein